MLSERQRCYYIATLNPFFSNKSSIEENTSALYFFPGSSALDLMISQTATNFPKPVFVHHDALQYFRNQRWQMIVTFITWLDEVSKTFFHLSESADANK